MVGVRAIVRVLAPYFHHVFKQHNRLILNVCVCVHAYNKICNI